MSTDPGQHQQDPQIDHDSGESNAEPTEVVGADEASAAPTARRSFDKVVTERQQRANEANAQKSTGPTSDEGKAISRHNALVSGVWARELHPITQGPFLEPDWVYWDRAEALIESFAPRDVLEFNVAKLASAELMRLDRIEAWEASIIIGVSNNTSAADPANTSGTEKIQAHIDQIDELLALLPDVLADRELQDPAGWEVVTRGLFAWSDKYRPPSFLPPQESAAKWEALARGFLDDRWPLPEHEGCLAFFQRLSITLRLAAEDEETAKGARVATRVINSILNQADRPRTSALNRFLKVYRTLKELQERELPTRDS